MQARSAFRRLEPTPPRSSRFARLTLTLAGAIFALASVIAGATIWLCLTEPVAVADAVGRGEWAATAKVVFAMLLSGLEQIVRYL